MASVFQYYQLQSQPAEIIQCLDFYQKIFNDEKKFHMQIHDRYVEHSNHYAIKNGKHEIIALYRIVKGSSRHDFPVGEFTELPLIDNAVFAEFSRLAIHPNYRKGKISIEKTFANLIWNGKKLGVTHFIGEPTLDLVGFYERFGFQRYGEPFVDTSISSDKGEPNSMLIVASVDDLYLHYFPENHI